MRKKHWSWSKLWMKFLSKLSGFNQSLWPDEYRQIHNLASLGHDNLKEVKNIKPRRYHFHSRRY